MTLGGTGRTKFGLLYMLPKALELGLPGRYSSPPYAPRYAFLGLLLLPRLLHVAMTAFASSRGPICLGRSEETCAFFQLPLVLRRYNIRSSTSCKHLILPLWKVLSLR